MQVMYVPAGWYRSIATAERREDSYRRFEMWYTMYRGPKYNRVQMQVFIFIKKYLVCIQHYVVLLFLVPLRTSRLQWGRAADAWRMYKYLLYSKTPTIVLIKRRKRRGRSL